MVRAFREIASNNDLLRAQGQVRQRPGIHTRCAQALEGDGQVADAGLGNFGQQRHGRRARGVVAFEFPPRAAAETGDGLQDTGFKAAAGGHGMERGSLGAYLVLVAFPDLPGDRHRIGCARRTDAVAEVNHVRARIGLCKHFGHGLFHVGPSQRDAAGEEVACRGNRVIRYRHALAIFVPCRFHVGGHEAEPVFFTQGAQEQSDKVVLCTPLPLVHGGRRISHNEQVHGIALGHEDALPIAAGIRCRDEQQEIAVLATAMRDQRDFTPARVHLHHHFEITAGGVFLCIELHLRRVLRALQSRGVRGARDLLDRQFGVNLHIQRQLA